MPRCSFKQSILDSIKPPPLRFSAKSQAMVVDQTDYFDETEPRFGLRVSSNNVRTWIFLARVDGRLRRYTIGRAASAKGGVGLTLAQARTAANRHAVTISEGKDPKAEADSARKARIELALQEKEDAAKYRFSAVVDEYIERHAKVKSRSWRATERILKHYLGTGWGHKNIRTITRSDVSSRLREIEDASGRATANQVLAAVRHMFRWKEKQDERFTTPIIAGMGSGSLAPRERTLTEKEIRQIWDVLADDIFGSMVKLLFLTGQRRSDVAGMAWSEIDWRVDGGPVWTIPARRYKTKVDQTVPLTAEVVAVVKAQHRRLHCDLVFSTNGVTPFSGFGKKKAELDAAAETTDWTLHDIRRTVRTLLARLKVSSDTAELVIGHLPPGIVRTYDRHTYLEEKRDALERIAAFIAQVAAHGAATIRTTEVA